MAAPDSEAPPVGEEIHLPGPSLVPLLNAVGVALFLVGLTSGRIWILVGTVMFLVTTVLWIRNTQHDISELPAEHH